MSTNKDKIIKERLKPILYLHESCIAQSSRPIPTLTRFRVDHVTCSRCMSCPDDGVAFRIGDVHVALAFDYAAGR